MLVSYNWLKEYVDFTLNVSELADRLTMLGLEVGSIETYGDDSILEIDLTVNRGDCLSMIGIAREVGAITNNSLKFPSCEVNEIDENIKDFIKVEVEDGSLCPRYTARVVKDVKITDSPSWLREKLKKAGFRPINNVVDITNYVLMELGQPMHAFDYERIGDRRIIVRRAEREEITALDGITYKLGEDVLVIADSSKPVAIAGVIGGANTEVTPSTSIILLESALFDPVSVRQTAKRLGIQTESSYRFERMVDPTLQVKALNRASHLISEICEGKVIKGVIDICSKPYEEVTIELHIDKVNKVLGTNLTQNEIENLLTRLGFKVATLDSQFSIVKVPSFRQDVKREIDLIEEIARIYGYEKISITLPKDRLLTHIKNRKYEISKMAKDLFASFGFYEVITYTFIDPQVFDKIQFTKDNESRRVIKLANPLSSAQSALQTTLIPGLLEVIKWNLNRGVSSLKIFEIGPVFKHTEENNLPKEEIFLSGAAIGYREKRNWGKAQEKVNFYDLSGAISKLLIDLGLNGFRLSPGTHPSLHPGKTGMLCVKDKVLGFIGELHPRVREAFRFPEDVYIFELNWGEIISLVNLKRTYKPLPRYPSITRDIAVVIRKDIDAACVLDVIKDSGRLIEDIELFDVYEGEQIKPGYKSLAYSITYRSPNTTLQDEEVNEIHAEIIKALEEKLNAKLRG
ncbi:MAG: phenylalanine--tRNA ligase subunit beta [bacterium]|nr:phenylalanine--tRNA ligase subunit beta [bacterium]